MLAGAAALSASCASRAPQEAAPLAVRTAPVRTVAFAPTLDLSGSVAAARQVAVGAVVAGRVDEIMVRAGDRVAAGEPIARIDDASYRAAYAQTLGSAAAADAGVALARAQAEAARSRLALAQTTARRFAALYDAGAVARQQYDEVQAELKTTQASYAQAQAGIGAAAGTRSEARAAVDASKVPLAETLVYAPFDGVVLTRNVDPGAVVGPGSPIATVSDERNLELDVSLPEDAAGAVRPGANVAIRVDALGGRTIPGSIRAVIPSGDAALRSVLVKIDLAPQPGLYAGMFARARFPGVAHRAPAVPAAAVVTRNGQDGVFSIEGSHAAFVPVQLGATQGGWVEVSDLPARIRTVAISPVERLTDGTAVAATP
jgi:multidrug efflux pump subunit AcrA (membrane-fusion protein)